MEYTESIAVDSTGALKVGGIAPVSSGGRVEIAKATMTDSTLRNVIVETASSISTGALSVKGAADFTDDIFVEGSVTVRGTVMGSGPYVDSSDIRFKKNVTPIANALEKVCEIGGDYYEYRLEEFPERRFEGGRQMGWVADRVQLVAPELVREDDEGFKHVAYARSSALLGAALRELREEAQQEVQALRSELRAVRGELEQLQKQLSA